MTIKKKDNKLSLSLDNCNKHKKSAKMAKLIFTMATMLTALNTAVNSPPHVMSHHMYTALILFTIWQASHSTVKDAV